jgi:tRNA dimethylallyltransferase
MRAIGYREFFIQDSDMAEGGRGFRLAPDLAAVEALAARNSRRYAKRQITYFASIPQVRWIDLGDGGEDPVERIRAMAADFPAPS